MKTTKLIALTLLSLSLFSCSDDENEPTNANATKSAVIENYTTIVYANYNDAHADAVALKTAIKTFTTTPNEVNFTNAKQAWLTARESYGTTEAFRFASGPIDDADGPEGLLNAWPLDENYIDYVSGLPNSGIINDLNTYPTITKTLLESLNEVGGEKNISIGYHAIEFLLWGQDLTAPSKKKAGQRTYTDYVDGGSNANQARRSTYLNICADLLIDHLQLMLDEWKIGGTYRDEFLSLEQDIAIKNIFTGISTLAKSELAGERIFVAYDNQDQEDEHSCFSDNTHRDVRLNLEGIENVYTGTYGAISGASLADLVSESNTSLGAEINTLLSTAVTSVDATAIPFDFAISDGSTRPAIVTAVNALRTVGDKFVAGAAEIDITVSAELPE